MARRKNQPEAVKAKCHLSERLRQVRVDLFGERGGSEMARRLGLPVRTWYNYEAGVTVPAEVLLRFVELTSVEPMWLLHGRGPQYRDLGNDVPTEGQTVQTLLRKALRRLEQESLAAPVADESLPAESFDSYGDEGDVVLMGVDGTRAHPSSNGTGARQTAAHKEWMAARNELRCVRVEGDAMAPIIASGALVAYADTDDDPAILDGQLVVAWVNGQTLVRWLRLSGRLAMLRAENPTAEEGTLLIDLDGAPSARKIRRVVGISTPH